MDTRCLNVVKGPIATYLVRTIVFCRSVEVVRRVKFVKFEL
jgi:hypothetical protein